MNIIEQHNEMQRVIRVAFYIRVSTSEQVSKENSLPAQKIALEKYAEENGMKIVGLYADEGKTAAKQIKKRKAIHALLADIEAGKIDLVIFTRFDRFTRNPVEYYKMMESFDKVGIQWRAIAQPELDLNTPMGQTLILFYLGIGQQEISNISERVKATAQIRIQKGLPITGPQNMPFTHTIILDENGNKIVAPDPEQLPTFWAYVDHYELNHSKRAAMAHANEMTGANHSYNTYTKAINNTLAWGHYKGTDNYCTPLVTKERWESWQQINKKNVRERKGKQTYVFTQLCICSCCGKRMSGQTCKPKDRAYYYYRCNKHYVDRLCENKKRTSEIKIEEYLLEQTKPEIERYIAEYEIAQKEPVKKPSNVEKIKKLEKRLQRVNYQYEEDRISQEEYDQKYKEIVEEMNALRDQDETPEITERDLEPLRAFLSLDLDTVYKTLSRDEKRALWRSVVSEIVLYPDGRIEPKFF
jgi:DNA invertase Pin-like site-specific DNA recombinase